MFVLKGPQISICNSSKIHETFDVPERGKTSLVCFDCGHIEQWGIETHLEIKGKSFIPVTDICPKRLCQSDSLTVEQAKVPSRINALYEV